MRLILAAILGGLVVFFWGYVSHMLLPVGNMGMRMGERDDSALVSAQG